MTHSTQQLPGGEEHAVIALGVGGPPLDPSLTASAALVRARSLTLDIVQTGGGDIIQTGGGDYAARDIDKRQGTFYTIVNPAPRPTIARLAHRPPRPRPLRNFLDREDERGKLRPELHPGGGAWLHGPAGCGRTALLRQVANIQADSALPDGAAYVHGDSESSHLDDILQGLFRRFYMSDAPTVVTPTLAQNYLADIKALFLLDHLPLNHDDLVELTNVLERGAVLVAADGDAPDTLLDLPLRGLPRREAMRLCLFAARFDSLQPDTLTLLNNLCAALHDVPLALLLAGRLLRARAVPLPRLVAVLDGLIAEQHPPIELAVGQASPPADSRQFAPANGARDGLVLAARLSLMALTDDERTVLAALARVGGRDADLAALSAISQLLAPTVEAALTYMHELGLVAEEHERYTITSGSLRRVLDQQLPHGDERKRAAAFFGIAAVAHAGNLAWLGSEQTNLIAAIKTSLAAGQPAQAGTLAQAVQPALMLRGQWGGWGQIIEWADHAAQAGGDPALHAWALHERGTRAGLLGDRATAAANLEESRQLHHRIGDHAAAAVSKHNLRYLAPPAAPTWMERNIKAVAVVVGLTVVALVIALIVTSRIISKPVPPPTLHLRIDEDTLIIFSALDGKPCQGNTNAPLVSILADPSDGAASINHVTGCIAYTPDPNFYGDDRFTYRIDPDGGATITGTVNMTVNPVNDPPTPSENSVTANEDAPLAISAAALLTNDNDVESDTLTLVAVGASSTKGGSVALADGTVIYTPTANFNGADDFTYTVSDGHTSGEATGVVKVAVRPVNDPPVAGKHSATTLQGVPIDISGAALLSVASDVDGDSLALASVAETSARAGTVVFSGATITYTPIEGFTGADSFIYTIVDGHGGKVTGTANLMVNAGATGPGTPTNNPPIPGGDSVTTSEDRPLTIPVATLLANDADPDGDSLTIADVTGTSPHGGTVALGEDTITYTPAAGFSGADSFTYTVDDGRGGTATSTVGVTVVGVNQPPNAVDDEAGVVEDSGANIIAVLANDTSAPDIGETLTITEVSQAAHGTIAISGEGGELTYTPAADYNGPDSFTYTISDGHGGKDTATVSVTISSKNDPPHATDDHFTVEEDSNTNPLDVLHNDSSVPDQGETLKIKAVSQGQHGSVAIDGAGRRLTYTPNANYNGDDRFTYTISDSYGDTDEATVNIIVTPVNDAPVADDDTATTGPIYLGQPAVIDVLLNDNDIDDKLNLTSVSIVTRPTGGEATVDSTIGIITYSTGLYNGTDTFVYQVCDTGTPVLCDTATVTVTVVDTSPTEIPYPTNPPAPSSAPATPAPPTFSNLSASPDLVDYDYSCPPTRLITMTLQGLVSDASGVVPESITAHLLLFRADDLNRPVQEFSALMTPAGDRNYSLIFTITSGDLARNLQNTNGVFLYQISAINGAGVSGSSSFREIPVTRKPLC